MHEQVTNNNRETPAVDYWLQAILSEAEIARSGNAVVYGCL